MDLKQIKFNFFLEALFCILMIYLIISGVAFKDFHKLFLAIISLLSSFVPFIISKIALKKDIYIPNIFHSFFIIFLFSAQYLGEVKRFYYRFWWWDILLHGTAGILLVIAGYFIISELRRKNKLIIKSPLFTSLFIFGFSMTLETFWEVFEYLGDFLFKTHMLKSGLNDTMTDTMSNIICALIASTLYYIKEKNNL